MLFDMINDYKKCYRGDLYNPYLNRILDGRFNVSEEEVVKYINNDIISMMFYIHNIESSFKRYLREQTSSLNDFIYKYEDVFKKYEDELFEYVRV